MEASEGNQTPSRGTQTMFALHGHTKPALVCDKPYDLELFSHAME